ncbi:MAG: hypothetical protein IKQ90_05150 [Ruminococcus sp.]|nr:hypothetical protein [Ruminococcus sp.]
MAYYDGMDERLARENGERKSKVLTALSDPNCDHTIGRFRVKTPELATDVIGGTGLLLFYCAFDAYCDGSRIYSLLSLIGGIICSLYWLLHNSRKAQVDGEYLFVKNKKYLAGQLEKLYADSAYISLYCAGKRIFRTSMNNHHADSLVKWARAYHIPITHDPNDRSSLTKEVLLGCIGVFVILAVLFVIFIMGDR